MNMHMGKAEWEVIRGDITEQDTDAIVNAANNHLWMGAGVAGAIKRKGGPEIEQEAVAQGPVEIGGAVITGGGRLKAKYVVHAAGMGQDLHTDADKIRKATRSSLLLAEKKRLSGISFPAIGTGIGGFSTESCAHAMLPEVIEFLQKSSYVKTVRFVLFDEASFIVFKNELNSIFTARK